MWFFYMKKHFSSKRWKRHYNEILFYVLCVSNGLKPSFLWDIGPASVSTDQLSNFIKDLQRSSLISSDVIVIMIKDNVFISNTSCLLSSLNHQFLIMDITNSENDWIICKTNDCISEIILRLKESIKNLVQGGPASVKIEADYCLPSVFGLLLGYPLIYYFSIPNSLFSSEAQNIVIQWFNCLKQVDYSIFHNLRLETSNEFVTALCL